MTREGWSLTSSVCLKPGGETVAKRFGWQTELKPHAYAPLIHETIRDGYLCVFGDAHFWPGERSLAHEALCLVIKKILGSKLKLLIANGDIADCATASRHEPLGWQKLPSIAEELDAVRLRLGQISASCRDGTTKRATVGNHDSRMDRYLATNAEQFQDVAGFSLQDHIRDWPLSYAVLVNQDGPDPVFVVHSIRGGKYAPANNILVAGCTVVTGHLHSQKSMPLTQLLGRTIEGIDHGCLAELDGPHASYLMARPPDWRSGFVTIYFDADGRMFPSEFCRVQYFKGYSRAIFRNEVVCERKTEN